MLRCIFWGSRAALTAAVGAVSPPNIPLRTPLCVLRPLRVLRRHLGAAKQRVVLVSS